MRDKICRSRSRQPRHRLAAPSSRSPASPAAVGGTNPIDVVKVARWTGQASYDGTLDSAKVVRTEGWLALFKGFHTQWLRIGPHTTISLMIYEQTRRLAGLGFL